MPAETTYTRFAQFYDAYVGDYARDLPLYLALASKARAPILEIGCGSGRVLLPLVQAGHRVTGVDIAGEMLHLADEKLTNNHLRERCTLLNHNFLGQALPQNYGLALVTFYTFNYLLSPEEQKAFLDHVAETLLPGSVMALHLFYPNPLLHPETAGKWIEKGPYLVAGEKIFLQDFRRMTTPHLEERIQAFIFEGGRREEISTLRRYVTQAAIHRLLLDSGFETPVLIDAFDFQKQTLLTPDAQTTKEFVVLARRP
ncbi:MAG: class I SAM-dependent methyltransferase [Syntrophales bacterium LBB04]|jgi:cyclopropane fatty-acyl-phospholipid synthase-like methyltransferase|nr:class I SAM-dependent methyltransferase [Syntrophales bacterium LBB04]